MVAGDQNLSGNSKEKSAIGLEVGSRKESGEISKVRDANPKVFHKFIGGAGRHAGERGFSVVQQGEKEWNGDGYCGGKDRKKIN